MKRRLFIDILKSAVLFVAGFLMTAAIGCGSDDGIDDTDGTSGSGAGSGAGSTAAGAGGTDGGGELLECPATNPPYEDPYCYNPVCPINPGEARPDLKPKGNCCNTVDISKLESQLAPGETYDLELVSMVYIPSSNPHTMDTTVSSSMTAAMQTAGDNILLRVKDVPRAEDMEKDADGNVIPVSVTVEMAVGKLNCDGTWSFYGDKVAPSPSEVVENSIPDDPSRWKAKTLTVDYYGPEGEFLIDYPESASAQQGLLWNPRWLSVLPEPSNSDLDYELPIQFLILKTKTDQLDSSRSCFGSVDMNKEWHSDTSFWVFVPAKESDTVSTDLLAGQSICGLLAKGPGNGDCDDAQANWTVKPTAYCDDQGYCWMGDSEDEYYEEFWSELFEGESGCDSSGTHHCCDPAGEDSSMPACNAFLNLTKIVLAAVEITDQPVNDPGQVLSSTNLCSKAE